ncbi:GGDEF domain-containing protein [bacterium BFN5]|nr:GGDEF domain-containing protein [bacterium BFN5]QJW46779.1 GGDEF domain-containing protein [bacterium BFN5]
MTKILSAVTTIPFAMLVLVSAVYLQVPIQSSLVATIGNFSYVIFCIGMMLSWWFNRSRVFFSVAILALAQLSLSQVAVAMMNIPAYGEMIFPIVSVLLPMNILLFSSLKERGIFNSWGLKRFGVVLIQVAYVALAILSNDHTLLNFFYKEILAEPLAATAIPQPALMVYGMVFLLMLVKQLKDKMHVDNGFVAVLIATFIGLHLKSELLAIPIFFSLAAMILVISVVQDSYSMAYLDELTGLPARRALREDLLKLSGEYTIAMLDIDFFKKFNDTYGHDTGDDVLRLVASVLKNVTGGGKAFRYGGEEFSIVFPHAKISEVMPHLEKLRAAVEKSPYAYVKKMKDDAKKKPIAKNLFVTISIGVAERSEKNDHPDAVMKAADTALYRAKKKGRNCVCK